jgi:RND family efflux transporter MFP subunit
LDAARLQLTGAEDQLDATFGDAAIRQARIAVLSARTAVDGATQTYDNARDAVAAASIVAPADGIVEQLNVTAGLVAPSGDAIVLDTGGLQAQINVSESDLLALKVGQAATVTVTATSGTVNGLVAAIGPVGTAGTGGGVVTYPVQLTLQNVPAGIRSGMSVSVSVTIAQANDVLSVPAIALQGSTGAYTVRVLNADGSVTSHDVAVGLVTSALAEIQSGLNVGDRVITGVATDRTSPTGTTGGFGGFGGLNGGGGGFRQPVQNTR